ncbi:MAG TPA: formylmethanofuran dehydrogenase subunit E family protein [Syntrophales bacterium]|nr:formylmethanofuran dehydrogenase subunit E family protein [Syntrophales bacterium]
MTDESGQSWQEDFAKCADFHGHVCPGLAIGYRAAKAAMAWLGERRAPDEEVVVIAETDACGCDAIQVLTGCAFGRRQRMPCLHAAYTGNSSSKCRGNVYAQRHSSYLLQVR